MQDQITFKQKVSEQNKIRFISQNFVYFNDYILVPFTSIIGTLRKRYIHEMKGHISAFNKSTLTRFKQSADLKLGRKVFCF